MKNIVVILVSLLLVFLFWKPVFAIEQPDVLEVIELKGEITESTAIGFAKDVESITLNKSIRAVLLVVDSPGGSVLPTEAIYESLKVIKVPVVVWCNNMCASGGLYAIMSPSVKFIAVRDITITGSMGVVVHLLRYSRLLDWARVDSVIIASGDLKAIGEPTQPSNPKELNFLKEIVQNLAERFYSVVQSGRPSISIGAMTTLKTGQIVFGDQAVKIGLVDAVMSKDNAIKKAKELSGSQNIFTREELKRMSRMAESGSNQILWRNSTNPQNINELLSNTLEEIKNGFSIKFQYKMLYEF